MTTARSVHAGRRYRRVMLGVLAVGIVSLFVGVQVGQELAGLVVYAAAVVIGFGVLAYVRYDDSLAMQDEREARMERRASHLVVQLFGYAGLFAFVGLFLLDATGRPSIGPTVETLLYAYSAVSLTWGAVYLWLRYRP